jgi:micrococcal nuclease
MKHLVAWFPLITIALAAVPLHQQWQRSRLARPDYDDPNAAWLKPALAKSPSQIQSEHWNVVADSVEDGTTFQVQQGGQSETVRLACISAPSVDQPLGAKGRDYLRSLLAQANNHVILSVTETDRRGRKVAEVNIPMKGSEEEKFIQYEMVVAGWATPYEKYADHCPNWEIVQQAGNEAKQQHKGLWTDVQTVQRRSSLSVR